MWKHQDTSAVEHRGKPPYGLANVVIRGKKWCGICCEWKLRDDFGTRNDETRYECFRCHAKMSLVTNARQRARSDGIPSSEWPSKHDIAVLMVDTCPVFGFPLQFGGAALSRASATLDAIVQPFGHRKTNLALISFFANSIKCHGTPKDILMVGLAVHKTPSWLPAPIHEAACTDASASQCLRCKKRPISEVIKHKKWCNVCKALTTMLRSARQRASLEERPFVSFDIDGLYVEQCPILGIPLRYCDGKRGDDSATLDKIVPDVGYVPGNVWIISSLANTIKQDASATEILKVGLWLHNTIVAKSLESNAEASLVTEATAVVAAASDAARAGTYKRKTERVSMMAPDAACHSQAAAYKSFMDQHAFHPKDHVLAEFGRHARFAYRDDALHPEKVAILEAIDGWTWSGELSNTYKVKKCVDMLNARPNRIPSLYRNYLSKVQTGRVRLTTKENELLQPVLQAGFKRSRAQMQSVD